jgi:uncharacterized lipoprotein YajG
MKKAFFALLAVGALASCSQDPTCTCEIPEITDPFTGTVLVEATTESVTCTDCTSEEADVFVAECEAAAPLCTLD